MTQKKHDRRHGAQTRHSAIEAEAEHMKRWISHLTFEKAPGDVDERWPLTRCLVGGMAGATIAHARRHMRVYPSEPDSYCRRYAAAAETVAASLPPRLVWLWQAHYVEEQPLPACAERAGREIADALADYRDLLMELHSLVPTALKAEVSKNDRAQDGAAAPISTRRQEGKPLAPVQGRM